MALIAIPGCAALTNPVANGIPVQRVPPDLLGESKENLEAIPVTSLGQPRPDAYRLAANDLLGIWVEGILGEKGQPPPVQPGEKGRPPAIGYPVPVRADGTISLPFVDPIKVDGMTLEEAEAAIRKSYTEDKQIIRPGKERISVTLQQARTYHVLVIRQDSVAGGNASATPGTTAPGGFGFVIALGGGATGTRRGTGYALDLPAYENDVLNALAKTGGFPGSDAMNEVIIERGGAADAAKGTPSAEKKTTRIPLRVRKGQQPNISPQDVILNSGDAVYIEAREQNVYYTGGILIPGAWPLPRDVDLDILQAILQARGTVNNGGFSSLNTSGLTGGSSGSSGLGGLGNPSPTLVSVLRQTPAGKQVTIRVDLNRALRDPRERILVQPKDVILMQQTPQQALAGYFTNAFRYSISWTPAIFRTHGSSFGTLSGP